MELGRGDRFFLFDTPPDPGFDRLTELVCLTLGVPIALISLVADDRQFFKSAAGLTGPWAAARETPIRYSICRHVVAEGAMLVVPRCRGRPAPDRQPGHRPAGDRRLSWRADPHPGGPGDRRALRH